MDELKQLSVKFVADINEFTKSVNQIKQDLKSVSKTPVSSANLSKFVNQSTKGASTFSKNITSMTKSVLGFNKSLNAMARFGRFLVFSYLGRQLVDMTQNMLEAGASMVETQNLFEVAFGGMADQAEEFANKLERAWGVSATLTKQQTAYLDNMFKSMGATEEMAYGMSTGLVQLSHNIASLYDIDQQTAYEKLRSAMVGVSRPLLQLGINTKVAQLQQTAFEHGITSTNRELTQQEKLLATYWAIYDQTKSAWTSGTAMVNGQVVAIGDMTKTIMTNANMTRVLSNRLGDLARYWGLAFQPIVEFVLPILYTLLNALINVGKSFALFMGNLFGGNYKTIEDMLGSYDDGSAAFTYDDGLVDYLDDTEKGANKASKALSKLTGGIDELNILSQDSDSGSGGGFGVAGGGIENDIGLPDQDYIYDAISQGVADKINEIKNAFSGLTKIFKDVWNSKLIQAYVKSAKSELEFLKSFAIQVGGNILDSFKQIWDSNKDNAMEGLNNIIELLTNFQLDIAYAFDTYGQPVIDSVNRLVDSLTELLMPAISLASSSWQEFTAILLDVWNKYGLPIIDNISQFIINIIDLFNSLVANVVNPIVIPFLNALSDLWNNHIKYVVQNVLELVAKLVNSALEIYNKFVHPIVTWLLEVLAPVWNTLSTIISTVLGGILGVATDIINRIISVFSGIVDFITGVFTGNWELAWEGVKTIFKNVFGAIADVAKVPINAVVDVLNWIIDKVNSFQIHVDIPIVGSVDWDGLNIPHIPKLASGGIAYGETMAMVGEYANARSNPEVIAPLDKLQGMINNMSDEETNLLLREQNDLLRALLEKDTSVKIDGRSLNRALDKSKTKMGYAIMG